ncbi:CHAT domain protein [compost metagenome]
MKAFYKNLGSGKYEVSSALRQAQLDFISGAAPSDSDVSPSKLEHPYYWAAFSLIGNWR